MIMSFYMSINQLRQRLIATPTSRTLMGQSEANRAITVGVISDTHRLLCPEALEALEGSECIMHAGDLEAY